MPKTQTPERHSNMGVRMDAEQRKKLKALSRAAGKPEGAVLRDLIDIAEVVSRPRYRLRTDVPDREDETTP